MAFLPPAPPPLNGLEEATGIHSDTDSLCRGGRNRLWHGLRGLAAEVLCPQSGTDGSFLTIYQLIGLPPAPFPRLLTLPIS